MEIQVPVWKSKSLLGVLFARVLYAGLITILATGAAVLAELFLAGLADIPVMLTGSAVHAGIVRIRFHDFDVSFDLFSDRGRILPDDETNCLKGKMVRKGRLYG